MRNEIVVQAGVRAIYERAAATEAWPHLLPHYRYVRVLSGDARQRIVEMAARRGAFPVRWRAEQINDPVTPQIIFRHLGGWTRGMQVFWRFEPAGSSTRVIIDHELRSPLAPFIGKFFIDPIANKTLACMKAHAERS